MPVSESFKVICIFAMDVDKNKKVKKLIHPLKVEFRFAKPS